MKNIKISLSKNFKAKQYEEHENMMVIQDVNELNTPTTDIIFNKDGSLKMIASKLEKRRT